MAKVISGLRVARSFVTPSGAVTVSRELDFNLGSDQGIQIEAVLGIGVFADNSPAASDTVLVQATAIQTIHLETATIEDPPQVGGEDEDDIDTEIIFAQTFGHVVQVPATAGGGGGSIFVTPSGLVVFAQPIQTARNITHSGKTEASGQELFGHVYIYYRYVEFTNAELGFLLARRQ